MKRSTAQGLAGGGALLAAFSLVTPWYILAQGSLRGEGKSGAAALGGLALIFVALALVAGWSMMARAHPVIPVLAAGGLALVVLVKIVSPPAPASGFGAMTTSDPVQAKVAEAFANALSASIGLHYATTWGIWLAAIGAAMALAGTIASAGQVRR